MVINIGIYKKIYKRKFWLIFREIKNERIAVHNIRRIETLGYEFTMAGLN